MTEGTAESPTRSGLDLQRPWVPLTTQAIAALPAQLGVYQIGDDEGRVAKIGYAGATAAFGIQTALEAELEAGTGSQFRHQFTSGYLTRWEELLMVHVATHGELPPGNADHPHPVGTLGL